MNTPTEDRDLREAYRHLRTDLKDPGRVPPFHLVFERARLEAVSAAAPHRAERSRRFAAPPIPWLSSALRAGLAAAAAASILITSGARDPERDFQGLVSAYTAASPSMWRSPTSRLLDVPGLELVRSVPAIGISVPDALRDGTPDPPAPTRESRS